MENFYFDFTNLTLNYYDNKYNADSDENDQIMDLKKNI